MKKQNRSNHNTTSFMQKYKNNLNRHLHSNKENELIVDKGKENYDPYPNKTKNIKVSTTNAEINNNHANDIIKRLDKLSILTNNNNLDFDGKNFESEISKKLNCSKIELIIKISSYDESNYYIDQEDIKSVSKFI